MPHPQSLVLSPRTIMRTSIGKSLSLWTDITGLCENTSKIIPSNTSISSRRRRASQFRWHGKDHRVHIPMWSGHSGMLIFPWRMLRLQFHFMPACLRPGVQRRTPAIARGRWTFFIDDRRCLLVAGIPQARLCHLGVCRCRSFLEMCVFTFCDACS
jgi:hypothetical protein